MKTEILWCVIGVIIENNRDKEDLWGKNDIYIKDSFYFYFIKKISFFQVILQRFLNIHHVSYYIRIIFCNIFIKRNL